MLVVEDNDGVRDYAKEVLEHLGYRVLEAGDADDGSASSLSDGHAVDLLFTDVVLPGADYRPRSRHQGREDIGPGCQCSTPRAIRATPSSTRGGSIPTFSY